MTFAAATRLTGAPSSSTRPMLIWSRASVSKLTLRPSTLMAVVLDYVASLARTGFTRLYFLNGHGGNVATIEAAFSELYAEVSYRGGNRGFACKLKNWWDLKGVMSLANRSR